MSTEEGTAARVAHNEAMFREANERIASAAVELDLPAAALPFLCECERAGCTQILRITLADYQRVRSNPRRFVAVPDHAHDNEHVVEEQPGYVVVEKQGRTGELAEELA